jgi:hypothetical protein
MTQTPNTTTDAYREAAEEMLGRVWEHLSNVGKKDKKRLLAAAITLLTEELRDE